MGMQPLSAITCTLADTAYPVSAALITAGHATGHMIAHAIFFQQASANTGRGYVGNSTLKPSTNTGVIGYMGVPSSQAAGSFTIGEENAPNGQDMGLLYVASTVAGDIILVSYYES